VGGNANLGNAESAPLLCGLETRKCTKCKGAPKPLTDFLFKKGEVPGPSAMRISTCRVCGDKKRQGRLEKERREKDVEDKENEPPADAPAEPGTTIDHTELANLALSDFLSNIVCQHTSLKFEANVDLAPYGKEHTRRPMHTWLIHCVEAMNLA
jgi:hypothetical protein